jgi:hypothetical protein
MQRLRRLSPWLYISPHQIDPLGQPSAHVFTRRRGGRKRERTSAGLEPTACVRVEPAASTRRAPSSPTLQDGDRACFTYVPAGQEGD